MSLNPQSIQGRARHLLDAARRETTETWLHAARRRSMCSLTVKLFWQVWMPTGVQSGKDPYGFAQFYKQQDRTCIAADQIEQSQ